MKKGNFDRNVHRGPAFVVGIIALALSACGGSGGTSSSDSGGGAGSSGGGGGLKASVVVVHSFGASSTDGLIPRVNLITGTDGNLYGTTYGGGANSKGTVFKMTPAGVETVLYAFGASGVDGAYPNDVIQGADGNFYGATKYGGANNDGAIFEVTSAGTETIIYSFGGTTTDGIWPQTGVVQGADGNFYGTTYQGGSSNKGTVFRVTPAGIESVLYSFSTSEAVGAYPNGLFRGADGNFYGTTGGNGAAFEITPAGLITLLHTFGSTGVDGITPQAGLVQGPNGSFYGTTSGGGAHGGGTVFMLTTAGVETVLYSFGATPSDGNTPLAGVTLGTDGNLYGTTYQGGGQSSSGIVYRVTPAGVETILHSFRRFLGELGTYLE